MKREERETRCSCAMIVNGSLLDLVTRNSKCNGCKKIMTQRQLSIKCAF